MYSTELRTQERIRYHYDIEVELAERLKKSPREARRVLYSQVYDELFRMVPDHPQLTLAESDETRQAQAEREVDRFARFLTASTVYLEIGPGDCRIAIEAARRVAKVYALDVSAEITKAATLPANVELTISDGTSVPLPPNSVDFAYSNQLIEHLHPQDATDQMRNVYAALKPGGKYLCITPNRLSGPHDISVHYDRIARGLHLHEYDARELGRLFKSVGYRRCDVLVGSGARYVVLPLALYGWIEAALALLPRSAARHRFVNGLLNLKLVGTK